MLHELLPESDIHKGYKFWFDEDGTVYWGKTEDNLQSAEVVELSSGYSIPHHIYVADLKNAFILGRKVEAKKEEDF